MIVLSVAFTVPLDPLYLNARKPDDSPINQRDEMMNIQMNEEIERKVLTTLYRLAKVEAEAMDAELERMARREVEGGA